MADACDAVEREVRPEAVRVREQGALRLAGRARGVDEEERVVVLARRRRSRRRPRASGRRSARARPRRRRLARAPRALRRRARAPARRGRAGRRSPGAASRHEIGCRADAEPRAGEERRDVVGRGAGEGREAVPAPQAPRGEAGCEAGRATVERRVGELAAEEPDRGAVGGRPRAVGEPAPDRQLAAHAPRSSRNRVTDSTKASGCSQKKRCPASANRSRRALREVLGEELAVARVDDSVLGSGLDERRRDDLGQAVETVERRPGRRLRHPGDGILRCREPVGEDRLDELGALASGWPARGRSRHNRRSATCGSSVAASAISATVPCGIGCAFGPPGVVQASTSRSTRSGDESASSCATMPPRLVPTTCARSTPASSSTCTASPASCSTVYGPGGASLSPIPRLSKRITSNRSASPGRTGSQPQRA